MIRIIFAIFLMLHGLVHLLWFVVSWQLMDVDGLPYTTTIVSGRVDVGESGIRVVGLLWALGMIGFVAAGIGLLFAAPWWFTVTIGATVYSLFLSVLGWPDSCWGALIDVAILVILLFGDRIGLSFLP